MRLALLLLAASAATPAAERKIMAVLELRTKLKGAEKEAIDSEYLTERIRSAALDAEPGLKMMTRENVLVLLKSSGKKLEESEGECQCETGQRLGPEYVHTG